MHQFDSSFSDPPVSIIILHHIFFFERGHIDKCQTGETGENENIPYQCQSGYSEFLIHNGL